MTESEMMTESEIENRLILHVNHDALNHRCTVLRAFIDIPGRGKFSIYYRINEAMFRCAPGRWAPCEVFGDLVWEPDFQHIWGGAYREILRAVVKAARS